MEIWGLILASNSLLAALLWELGPDDRYDQINVTYKSTEKVVPIMKVKFI